MLHGPFRASRRKDDAEVQKAMTTLRRHFTNRIGKPIKTPYYLTQLQILYEFDHYPWIISDATKELESEGFLTLLDKNLVPEIGQLQYITNINFFAHSSVTRNRNDLEHVKKRAITIAKIVNQYSNPDVSHAIGKHLESLVRAEIKAQDFKIVNVNSNEYNGKKWTRTDHNLDIIAEHKLEKFAIGVEVKNTLDLIEL